MILVHFLIEHQDPRRVVVDHGDVAGREVQAAEQGQIAHRLLIPPRLGHIHVRHIVEIQKIAVLCERTTGGNAGEHQIVLVTAGLYGLLGLRQRRAGRFDLGKDNVVILHQVRVPVVYRVVDGFTGQGFDPHIVGDPVCAVVVGGTGGQADKGLSAEIELRDVGLQLGLRLGFGFRGDGIGIGGRLLCGFRGCFFAAGRDHPGQHGEQ